MNHIEGAFQGTSAEWPIWLLIELSAGTLLSMGTTAFFLKAHDAVDKVTFGDLWHPQSYVYFLSASLLVMCLCTFGFILFIRTWGHLVPQLFVR